MNGNMMYTTIIPEVAPRMVVSANVSSDARVALKARENVISVPGHANRVTDVRVN